MLWGGNCDPIQPQLLSPHHQLCMQEELNPGEGSKCPRRDLNLPHWPAGRQGIQKGLDRVLPQAQASLSLPGRECLGK